MLFRQVNGELGALEDRCPHRQVPLSIGRCESRWSRCGHHRLLFDAERRRVYALARASPTECSRALACSGWIEPRRSAARCRSRTSTCCLARCGRDALTACTRRDRFRRRRILYFYAARKCPNHFANAGYGERVPDSRRWPVSRRGRLGQTYGQGAPALPVSGAGQRGRSVDLRADSVQGGLERAVAATFQPGSQRLQTWSQLVHKIEVGMMRQRTEQILERLPPAGCAAYLCHLSYVQT